MASRVEIEVTIDEKGVVTGVQNVNKQLDTMGGSAQKAGQQSGAAFGRMEKDQQRAADASRLFNRYLGLDLPKTMTKVIAQSELLGAALSGAFNIAILAGAAIALYEIGSRLKTAADSLSGYTENVRKLREEAVKVNQEILSGGFKSPGVGRQLIAESNQITAGMEQVKESSAAARDSVLAGSNGMLEFATSSRTATGAQKQFQNQLDWWSRSPWENVMRFVAAQYAFREASDAGAKATAQQNDQVKKQGDLIEESSKKVSALRGQLLELQAVGPFQKIRGEEQAALKALAAEYPGALKATQEYGDATALIHAIAAQKIQNAYRDMMVQVNTLMRGSAKALLEQNMQEIQKRLDKASKNDLESDEQASNRKLALLTAERDAIYDLAETQMRVQGDAIGAMKLEEQKRVNDTIAGLRQMGIAESGLAEARVQLEAAANARIAAEWQNTVIQVGSDLEGVFDDITGGNLGNRILGNFKKLFAQIAAQWLLATKVINGLGAALLFGPGSTAASMLGGGSIFQLGAGGTGAGFNLPIPGMTGSSNGAGGFGAFAPLFGRNTAGFGSATGIGGAGGWTGSNTAAPYDASTLAQAALANGPFGTMGSLAVTPAKMGLSAMAKAYAPLAAMMLSGVAGNAIGGTAGMLGGSAMAMALMNPAIYGPLGAAIGIGGGALLGFGVGQKYGKLAGALSGAALTGFMFGGPLGAAIAGIIGLLGGIFGGSKRRKQAEEFAQQQIAELQKVVAGFKAHEIDYAGAISQIDQMQASSLEQLGALKSDGMKVYNRTIVPKITQARAEIEGWEKERERRLGLLYGPPMFQGGGTVIPSSMWAAPGGGTWAVVHPGEEVIAPGAAQRNRSLLKDINAGRAPVVQGSSDTYNIYALDSKSFEEYLKNRGGFKALGRVYRQARGEGRPW